MHIREGEWPSAKLLVLCYAIWAFLCSVPLTHQQCCEMLNKFVITYIDDILIFPFKTIHVTLESKSIAGLLETLHQGGEL